MEFKLVRIDTSEPQKIDLPEGTHIIGRGKFIVVSSLLMISITPYCKFSIF